MHSDPCTVNFAISLKPIDWGLMGASAILLISAGRTFVSGQGKSGMGLGFMIIASAVFIFAIGRQVTDFSALDGLRVMIGVLFLVPVLRAILGKGDTTFGVISLLITSVAAGPVIARAFPEHVKTTTPYQVERVERQITSINKEIEAKQAVWEGLISEMTQDRASLEALGLGSTDELESNPAALELAQRYAKLDAETTSYKSQIDQLKRERQNLETCLLYTSPSPRDQRGSRMPSSA